MWSASSVVPSRSRATTAGCTFSREAAAILCRCRLRVLLSFGSFGQLRDGELQPLRRAPLNSMSSAARSPKLAARNAGVTITMRNGSKLLCLLQRQPQPRLSRAACRARVLHARLMRFLRQGWFRPRAARTRANRRLREIVSAKKKFYLLWDISPKKERAGPLERACTAV